MSRPLLTTEESPIVSSAPILLIDKKGIIGVPLAERLREAFLTIFVTAKNISHKRNMVTIPFQKKVPKIPNNSFSHILVVYNGEKALHAMLPAIIKKAKHDHATLMVIMQRSFAKGPFLRELLRRHEKTVVVLFGDVFGDKAYDRSLVTALLSEAVLDGSMTVPGNGLTDVYPIHFQDFVTHLLEIFFTKHEKQALYAAFPKHPMTALSFARIVAARFPDIHIDFDHRKKDETRVIILPRETIYLTDAKEMQERMRDMPLARVLATPVRFIPSHPGPRRRLSLRRGMVASLLLLLFVCILPFVGAGVGFASLFAAQSDVKRGEFAEATQKVSFAAQVFGISEKGAMPFLRIARIIGAEKEGEYAVGYITTGKDVSKTVGELITIAETMQRISVGKSTRPKADFTYALKRLSQARVDLTRLSKNPYLPAKERRQIEDVLSATRILDQTADVLPALFGFSGKKTYLVLLQNNFELRPGGGFIGSYALASVENGKLASFTVHDVYDADGQLKTQIEPPYFLRRYLGVKNWYLRDSNVDIDFPENAANAASFLEKETGGKVDGVIGIDVYMMQKLLTVLGNVTLPEYNLSVNAKNFFELTEKKAEENFFPGSTQKKDFLRSVANATLAKLTGETIPYVPLLLTANDALREKHLMVVTLDQTVQRVLLANDLSGAVPHSDQTQRTRHDVFAVSDTNIGLNKVNYYIKRGIEQRISFGVDGGMTGQVTVQYTNESTEGSVFGGEYVTYLRVLLPKTSEITAVSLDGEEQELFSAVLDPRQFESPRFVAPKGIEIERVERIEGSLFGLLVRVPQGSKKVISITYTLQEAYNPENMPFSYTATFVKQPGVAADPHEVAITYPESLTILNVEKGIQAGSAILQNDPLKTDKNISITFGKP